MFEHKGVKITVLETTEFKHRDGWTAKGGLFFVASCPFGLFLALNGPDAVEGAKRLIDAQT